MNGQLVLMVQRVHLSELSRRFDLSWFMQAIGKYRRLLGEVLVASFFLQIFALITLLFFRVVIDKVLVHRGLTTLDVLVIGLVTLSVFECVLTGKTILPIRPRMTVIANRASLSYVAHVSIDTAGIDTEQGFMQLELGMAVTAEIRQDREP